MMCPKFNHHGTAARSILTGGAMLLLAACGGQAAQSGDVTGEDQVNAASRPSAQHQSSVSIYGYKVINTYPHDETAFTQGLFFKDGYLYESTGLIGTSTLRKVIPDTGEIIQQTDIPEGYFGEGIVNVDGRLISLTWKSEKGFVYGLDDFSLQDEFSYKGEGWGITYDGSRLIMSDGTSQLRFLDPETLAETGGIIVTLRGKPIRNINELEWVPDETGGKIYANLWQTDWIAIIDPKNGVVQGLADMTGLLPEQDVIRMRNITRKDNVLNGIAWDVQGERLFVTGKNWPKLFEVELVLREVQ